MWYLLAELAVLLALAILLGLVVGWLLWRWRRPSIKASEYQKLISERDRYARAFAESQYRADQLEENLQSTQAQSGRALSERDHYEGLLAESESEAERLRQERTELVGQLASRPVPVTPAPPDTPATVDLKSEETVLNLDEAVEPSHPLPQSAPGSRRPPAVRQTPEARSATQPRPTVTHRQPTLAKRPPVVESRLSEVPKPAETHRQDSVPESVDGGTVDSDNPFIVHATPSDSTTVEPSAEALSAPVDDPAPTAEAVLPDSGTRATDRGGLTGLFAARADEPTIEPYTPLSQADDLQTIEGIDERAETFLNKHGISTYRQLGSLSEGRKAQMERNAPGLAERMAQEGWVDQAQRLYNEKF